jgi:hypothetical protein
MHVETGRLLAGDACGNRLLAGDACRNREASSGLIYLETGGFRHADTHLDTGWLLAG